MIDPNVYSDEIDSSRSRRARELSAIGGLFGNFGVSDTEKIIAAKAALVLCYASWEGFFTDCVSIYWKFLTDRGGRIRDTNWMLLLGAISSDLDSLRDRNHSHNARREFVRNLEQRLDSEFGGIDEKFINPFSNLNYDRIRYNYDLLGFDASNLEEFRIRLNGELVKWRNAVAHGDYGDIPDLSRLDISNHVQFTSKLLIRVADSFQGAILK